MICAAYVASFHCLLPSQAEAKGEGTGETAVTGVDDVKN